RRAGEALGSEARSEHACLGRSTEMQSLYHRSIGVGEFEQSTRERACDPKCVGHSLRVKAKQSGDRDRCSEGTRGAWSVNPSRFVGVFCSAADPDHHLGTGHECGDEVATVEVMLLRDRERRWKQRRAGMHATAWLGEIVELEGVCESTIG